MLAWINHKYGIHLNEEDLQGIKNFSLLWNIFEDTVCHNHWSVESVEQAIANNHINADDFSAHLLYFQNRYVTNGMFNERYPFLLFRNNDREPLVQTVLSGQNTNPKDIIVSLVIIVYRYRNNLFHGNKDIREIDGQKENFDHANQILQQFLNYCF